VDIKRDVRGFAYFGLLEDLRRGLSSVLSREVDIVDSQALDTMRERVLREAVPL
jgi:predicted nucleotidyltransferase